MARILGLLEPLSDDRSIVLVGGQPVSFWTRFLGERSSELGKTNALAMRQLQASIVCAREWSRYLLDDDPSAERVRAVLRINERVFRKCIHDMHFRGAETDLHVDPFQAVLVEHKALRHASTTRATPRCAGAWKRSAPAPRAAVPDHPLAS